MKKQGFMLIEVMVTLVIILTLLSIGISGAKSYKNYIQATKTKDFIYEVNDFLNFAKVFCARKGESGKVLISQENDSIGFCFYHQGKINRKCNIGYGLGLKIFFNNRIVDKIEEKVQNNGYIEANTIYFLQGEKVNYKLVIRPAANLIKIEEQ